jgi:hypothetical protein
VSRRLAVAALALVSLAIAPAHAEEAALPDLEGRLSPRALPSPPRHEDLPPVLQLSWADPSGAAVGLEVLVRGEVASLIEAMGVRVRWRRAASDELARADEVRVILLDRPATRDGGLLVLGATPPRFAVAPHVWIHVPSVRAAVGVPAGRSLSAMGVHERRVLGVALGRVAAHEVVHAVAPGVSHGQGLMSAFLVGRTLTAPSIGIDPGVGGAVRAGLAASAGEEGRPAQTSPEVPAHELFRGSGGAQRKLAEGP